MVLFQPSCRSIWIFGSLLLSVLSCRTPETSQSLDDVAPPNYPDCKQGSCRQVLQNPQQFDGLAGETTTGATTAKVVKIVYRRSPAAKAGKVYFINTKTYPFHYDFVLGGLGLQLSLVNFNKNYAGSGKDRNFNQASLVFHEDDQGKRILFEMWSGDTITAPHLIELYKAVKKVYKIDWPLVYHPLSTAQESLISAMNDAGFPTITTAELFQDRSYLSLNSGVAYGYLAFAKDGDDQCLDHTNIVVYDNVPNDIGLFAGVVTAQFQTPLSHVNVKSINRGTVNMVLRDAFEELKQYEGKPVSLVVGTDDYEIKVLSPTEADQRITQFWDSKRPSQRRRPASLSDPQLKGKFLRFSQMFGGLNSINSLRNRHQNYVKIFGAKATNLGMIHRFMTAYNANAEVALFDSRSPDGYAVPFDFFDEFMNYVQAGLDPNDPQRMASPQQLIDEVLAGTDLLDHTKFHSICQARTTLAKLRDIIQSAEVPPKMVARFKSILIDNQSSPVHINQVPRIRLRSSTNSEDLQGFNGAGLYNSAGVSLYDRDDLDKWEAPKTWEDILDGRRGLLRRIPFIYSSVWNDRAFEEREWFRMNGDYHGDVKVGIAVHMSFSKYTLQNENGEVANGVAVSKNIYNPNSESPALYINAQHYDLAVTNPPEEGDLEEYGEDPNQDYRTEEVLITPFVADPEVGANIAGWKDWSYQLLSRSSVKDGEQVLRDQFDVKQNPSKMEVRRLSRLIHFMSRNFARIYRQPQESFAIDTEWKIFGPKRRVWLKQARPLDEGRGSGSSSLTDGFAAVQALENPKVLLMPRLEPLPKAE